MFLYEKARAFGASVNDRMEEVFPDDDKLIFEGNGVFFSEFDRRKTWQLIEANIAKVVGPIVKQYTYKRGRWTTDVWDFGHKDVVFCLYNAKRGGLVAQFDVKREVEVYYAEAQGEETSKKKKNQLRKKAVDILMANGFTPADIHAMDILPY